MEATHTISRRADFQGCCVAFDPEHDWSVVEVDPVHKALDVVANTFREFVNAELLGMTSHESDGYVSLWVSEELDKTSVEAALAVEYTNDGDWVAPAFARAFGFTRFNPSTREANVLKSATTSVREALAGFSYDSVIAERFASEFGEELPSEARSVALLYNFRFSGTPTSAVIGDSTWTYVGCVPYASSVSELERLEADRAPPYWTVSPEVPAELGEEWYLGRHMPDAERHVGVGVTRSGGPNAGNVEGRVIDGVDGNIAVEIKDVAGKIDTDQLDAYLDMLEGKLHQSAKGASPPQIGLVKYVITKPEGAIANLEMFAKRLTNVKLRGRLVIEAFDYSGTLHIVTDAGQARALLSQLTATRGTP